MNIHLYLKIVIVGFLFFTNIELTFADEDQLSSSLMAPNDKNSDEITVQVQGKQPKGFGTWSAGFQTSDLETPTKTSKTIESKIDVRASRVYSSPKSVNFQMVVNNLNPNTLGQVIIDPECTSSSGRTAELSCIPVNSQGYRCQISSARSRTYIDTPPGETTLIFTANVKQQDEYSLNDMYIGCKIDLKE